MTAFDRRSHIMGVVRAEQRISTRALSERFGVSEVTIRQDLALLEQQGWVARVHGGAEATARLFPEEPHAERARLHLPEKQRIARAAAETVRDGDTLIIDSSTTAFQMTSYLVERRGLTVITNHVNVARVLSAVPGLQTILLGGTFRSESWSMVGPLAEEMVAKLHATRGFFGAGGFVAGRGFTDADPREAQIKRAMVAAVSEVTVLLDSTKFGRQSLMESIPMQRVSRLITSMDADDTTCEALSRQGIAVQKV